MYSFWLPIWYDQTLFDRLSEYTRRRICSFLYRAGADPGGTPGMPPPPKIGKNMIFGRKIVIFHTKYPNNFRTSLRSAQFF